MPIGATMHLLIGSGPFGGFWPPVLEPRRSAPITDDVAQMIEDIEAATLDLKLDLIVSRMSFVSVWRAERQSK